MSEYIEKPWGSELKWAHTAHYVGKILTVKAGEKLSIQYHNNKIETMYIYAGSGYMHFYSMDEDGEVRITSTKELTSGVSIHIPPKQIHRLEAQVDMVVLEVSTNHLNDLVRLKDKYHRN